MPAATLRQDQPISSPPIAAIRSYLRLDDAHLGIHCVVQVLAGQARLRRAVGGAQLPLPLLQRLRMGLEEGANSLPSSAAGAPLKHPEPPPLPANPESDTEHNPRIELLRTMRHSCRSSAVRRSCCSWERMSSLRDEEQQQNYAAKSK